MITDYSYFLGRRGVDTGVEAIECPSRVSSVMSGTQRLLPPFHRGRQTNESCPNFSVV